MRVMVIIKSTDDAENGVMPTTEELAAMGAYNEELVKAGVMLAGEGLHPTSRSVRVRFKGTSRTVLDGPFAEAKEVIAGFWIWQVRDMAEALAWVEKMPCTESTDGEIEIRRIQEDEDFGEAFTPELRAQEQQLRDMIANRAG